MPRGVEHLEPLGKEIAKSLVRVPVMPRGVEHKESALSIIRAYK